ncbi:MAG TPA: diadenylate cyclase [Syntrophobacteria bacterium]|nr:diadenylate cyclase [Syntrophobacteria bacterium]
MPSELFFPFKWQDVADILVISFIVHRLFLLFRGTTALQIMVGLLFLWLFQGIAQATGLVLTSWFFQGAGAVAVLVIVVVFRNEIREVLIQTNPVRFFLGRPRESQFMGVGIIAAAAFELAVTRTGALIVLQNRDHLEGHLVEGFPLDGRLIPHILESIFCKESPVHDGATVIRGNRIARVGTFLPLTRKEGLPQQFGTRHRAAIGLSELTDAVILVVSEERGEISLVHKGIVEGVHDRARLEQELKRLLTGLPAEGKPQPRRRAVITQIGGFLLTFLLVAVIWGVYSGGQLSLVTVTAPVYFRNIPANLELRKASAEKVEVQITGKRQLVAALKTDQVRAFLDLQSVEAGAHRLDLSGENISLPPGLDVVRITPANIKVEMEPFTVKEVAVKPEFTGSPPRGYQVDTVRVKPRTVKVGGSSSALRTVASLSTDPIDLGTIPPERKEKTFEVPLVLYPASLHLLPEENRTVRVTIRLRPQSGSAEGPPGPQP